MPPEGPWELQGVELLSQNELYRQVLLLLHLLPQDLLLLQVRPLSAAHPLGWCPEVGVVGVVGGHPPPISSSPEAAFPPSPASLPTATVRRCWTVSSSVGSWLQRR